MTVFNRYWSKWPDENNGPFDLWTTVAVTDGHAEVVGVEMFSIDPDSIVADIAALRTFRADNPHSHFSRLHKATDAASEAYEPEPSWINRTGSIRNQDIRLPLAKIVEAHMAPERELAKKFLEAQRSASEVSDAAMRAAAELLAEVTGEGAPKKLGRPATPRDHYVEVAEIYVEARFKGTGATRSIMDHYNVTKSCASKWVSKCRHTYGLLPLTRQGVPKSVAEADAESVKAKSKRKRTR
jgi:hypothetical protein